MVFPILKHQYKNLLYLHSVTLSNDRDLVSAVCPGNIINSGLYRVAVERNHLILSCVVPDDHLPLFRPEGHFVSLWTEGHRSNIDATVWHDSHCAIKVLGMRKASYYLRFGL